MEFSSKLLENAVNEIAQLPGIGKRTALRLALHLIKQPKEQLCQNCGGGAFVDCLSIFTFFICIIWNKCARGGRGAGLGP